MWSKQLLLSVTGKTFFLSTLDLEIYNMFELYMGGESRWQQRFYNLFSKKNLKESTVAQ
jgi:hypothetical protein